MHDFFSHPGVISMSLLRNCQSTKSNQRRFVYKFCEKAYKDSKRKDIISKRNISLLSSFFIEKDATCQQKERCKCNL